jgi:two-component system chemotaxis response regulator CheY
MAYSVMIVDDSPAMRKFMRRVMELTGIDTAEYREAGNGREALDQLRQKRVDLILTDINMPLMNGEQLVESLDADPDLRDIPVVVVSTDGSASRVQRMLDLGAKGYVTKPFHPENLREELERVLEEADA